MKNGGVHLIESFGIDKEIKRLQSLVDAYYSAEDNVRIYTEHIKDYQDTYAKFTEEKYNEISQTVTATTEDWTKKTLENIKTSITDQSKTLDFYKSIYVKFGNEIAIQNVEQAKKNIQVLADELASRTSTIENLGKDEIEAWRILATNSYDIYSQKLNEMDSKMAQKIQDVTGVIAIGTPQAVEAMNKLSTEVIEQLDKSPETKRKALDTLQCYLKGISDEEKRNLLKEAGIDDVEKVMEGLKEGNLAEDQGVNILKSLQSGLQNSKWQGNIFGTASGLAKKLTDTFSIRTTVNPKTIPGHKDGLDYVPYDNYVARLHKGERVLTAKENKEYSNGNINNKLSTQNIVLNFYPQKMSDQEMERAFNFVDRRYSKIYN